MSKAEQEWVGLHAHLYNAINIHKHPNLLINKKANQLCMLLLYMVTKLHYLHLVILVIWGYDIHHTLRMEPQEVAYGTYTTRNQCRGNGQSKWTGRNKHLWDILLQWSHQEILLNIEYQEIQFHNQITHMHKTHTRATDQTLDPRQPSFGPSTHSPCWAQSRIRYLLSDPAWETFGQAGQKSCTRTYTHSVRKALGFMLAELSG